MLLGLFQNQPLSLKQRLCGRRALSLAAVVILGPLSVLSNFYRLADDTLAINRFGFVAFSLVIGLGFVVLLSLLFRTIFARRGGRPFLLWLVLGAYVLIGIVRGCVPYAAGAIGLIPAQPFVAQRMAQSIVICVVWFSLTAIVMDSIDRQHIENDNLEVREIQLSMHSDHAEKQLVFVRAATGLRITTAVVPTLELLKSGIDRALSGGSTQLAVRQVAEQLRIGIEPPPPAPNPELTEYDFDEEALLDSLDKSRLGIPELLRLTVTGVPFLPLANACFIFLLFAWPVADPNRLGPLLGIPVVAVVALLNFLITAGAASVYPRVRNLILQTVIWIASLVVIGVLTAAPFALLTELVDSFTPVQALFGILYMQLWGGALIAMAKAASDRLQRDKHSLQAANVALELEVAAMKTATGSVLERADNLIAVTIPERLAACAIALETVADSPSRARRAQALNETWNILSSTELELSTTLDTSLEARPLRQTLDAIAEQWRGTVEVTIHPIDQSLEAKLAPRASEISQVVREGINNAAKNGAATDVSVRVELKDESVRILMVDNGTAPIKPLHTAGGLGALVSQAADFNLTKAARGTTQLQVILPLYS